MDKQSKQLLVDFINQTTKQYGYAFRVLSAMDSTDAAFESAFKQLKELQVEQMKPEVEIDPASSARCRLRRGWRIPRETLLVHKLTNAKTKSQNG